MSELKSIYDELIRILQTPIGIEVLRDILISMGESKAAGLFEYKKEEGRIDDDEDIDDIKVNLGVIRRDDVPKILNWTSDESGRESVTIYEETSVVVNDNFDFDVDVFYMYAKPKHLLKFLNEVKEKVEEKSCKINPC